MRSRVLGVGCVMLCLASTVGRASAQDGAAATRGEEDRAGQVESATVEGDEDAAEVESAAVAGGRSVPPIEFFPLEEGIVFERYSISAEGADATAVVAEQLVFSNTLGKFKNAPGAGNLVSDDISLIVPGGCKLRRYEIPVLGRVNPANPVRGKYTVVLTLYSQCPGSVDIGSIPTLIIPNTQVVITFNDQCRDAVDDDGDATVNDGCPAVGPAEAGAQCLNATDDDGDTRVNDGCPQVGLEAEIEPDLPRLISFVPPGDAPLPTNFWLGFKFDRDNAGVVFGAPPMVGFSCDQYDYPGSPCTAWAGGFPAQPHASFNFEVYVDSACANSFTGYKNDNPKGGTFNAGVDVTFADDIQLITAPPPTSPPTTCNMIAYEVAVKGDARYTFDLRTSCNGGIIVNTRKEFDVFGTTEPQIARFTFDTPIALPNSFFLSAKISAASGGVVVSGQQACIGQTADSFQVAGPAGCNPIVYPPPPSETPRVHAAFSASITCAGPAPVGACCDMFIPDVNGEAICRQVPEVNCPFPPRFLNLRPEWVQGAGCSQCNDAVDDDGDGKVNDGCAAVSAAESGAQCSNALDDDSDGKVNDGCPAVGPAEPGNPFSPQPCGVAACCPPDGGPCQDLTLTECNALLPLNSPRQWQLGQYCNQLQQSCPNIACLARTGECSLPRCNDGYKACSGGANNGKLCSVTADCRVCVGGTNPGTLCTSNAQCLGGGTCPGACVGGSNPGAPCTSNAQCLGGGSCGGGTCKTCREDSGVSACYVSPTCCDSCPPVGCEDAECCTAVCAIDVYCCDVVWDDTCAADARTGTTGNPPVPICDVRPGNDVCIPAGRLEGARLMTTGPPGNTAETDAGRATADPGDPRFGCYLNNPGTQGLQTVWYRFVATHDTALLQTCNSLSPANDSLLSVYAVGDPSTRTTQCNSLIPVGCSDDFAGCSSGGKNSKVCVRNLVVGNWYYVLVASKVALLPGKAYRLDISAPCTQPVEGTLNNYCPGAAAIITQCKNATDDDSDTKVNDGCPGVGKKCRLTPFANCTIDADCGATGPCDVAAEVDQCQNAIDDDGDPAVNDGCPAIGPAETGAQCLNAIDDDGDGTVNDGCPAVGPAETGAQCLNAIDDDGDPAVNDGCPAVGPAESGANCRDAIDNDGDGKVNDGCPAVGPAEFEQCQNAIDNDGDGSVNDGCPAVGPAETDNEGITAFNLGGTFPETMDAPKLACISTMTIDEWYKYTATCSGQLTVDTCGPTPGVGPDTNLAIYGGDVCPQLVGSAAPIECSADFGSNCGQGGMGSKIVLDAVQGQIYKIRLADSAGNLPSGNLKIGCVQAPCPAGVMTFTNPPDGVVDAGRPHDPDNAASLQGIQTITATGPPDALPSCFSFCETIIILQCQNATDDDGDTKVNDGCPAVGPSEAGAQCLNATDDDGDGSVNDGCPAVGPAETDGNKIDGVVQNPIGTHTITLHNPITAGALTTITYTDVHGRKSSGHYSSAPANVNDDLLALAMPSPPYPSDVQYLLDALNGLVALPWGDYSSDINRSLLFTPADLLEVIDLLNGAGAFEVWDFTFNPSGNTDCPLP